MWHGRVLDVHDPHHTLFRSRPRSRDKHSLKMLLVFLAASTRPVLVHRLARHLLSHQTARRSKPPINIILRSEASKTTSFVTIITSSAPDTPFRFLRRCCGVGKDTVQAICVVWCWGAHGVEGLKDPGRLSFTRSLPCQTSTGKDKEEK